MDRGRLRELPDRLSELPEELISKILFFLPMRDVVKTPVLSKRWRNFWTTTPSLNFENDTMQFHDTENLRIFVNEAIFHWKGTKILKFKFESCYELKQSISSAVDYWVVFAKLHKVEELYLHMKLENMDIRYYEAKDGICWVPPSLYSCPSLKVLSLRHFNFIVPPRSVRWDQLKSLTITEGFGISGNLISRILSGSPQLEVLIFSFDECMQTFNIESESLKELSIEKYLFEHDDLCFDSKLTISTPKLEKLKLLGIPYNHCSLMNISSLSHATLGFSGLHYFDQDYGVDHPWEDFDQEFDTAQDFVGDKLSQLLQTIHLVENVTLFCCCVRVLEAMKNRSEEQSSFSNVKFLKIGCCHENYAELVGLLQIFPQLERLVLQNDREDFYLDDEEPLKFDADSYQNLPESFLLQLRTIDVTWDEKDSVFPFIEILLKYASMLEHMVFRGKGIEPSSVSSAEQKLLRIPKSSSNCKIDFLLIPRSSSKNRHRSSDSKEKED